MNQNRYNLCVLIRRRDNIHFDLQKKNQLFTYFWIEILYNYYYDIALATSMENESSLLKKALPKNDILGDGLVICLCTYIYLYIYIYLLKDA